TGDAMAMHPSEATGVGCAQGALLCDPKIENHSDSGINHPVSQWAVRPEVVDEFRNPLAILGRIAVHAGGFLQRLGVRCFAIMEVRTRSICFRLKLNAGSP